MPDFEPDDTTEIPVYVDPVPLPRERGLRDISLGIVIGVLASLLIVAGTAAGVVITNWPHHAVAADAAATPTAGPRRAPPRPATSGRGSATGSAMTPTPSVHC